VGLGSLNPKRLYSLGIREGVRLLIFLGNLMVLQERIELSTSLSTAEQFPAGAAE